MITRLTVVACIAAAAVVTAAAASPTRSGQATHFAGFPPVGVNASTPTTGTLAIGLRIGLKSATTEWNVYADGRVIWQKWTSAGDATVVPKGARTLDTGYVQQRLTLPGLRLLRSKILATGLFEHDLLLDLGNAPCCNPSVFHQVRIGDRMVTVEGVSSPDPSWNEHFTKATPAQKRALAFIAALVADPAAWLPPRVWTDRQIRAFVPARYMVAFDRGYPDLSKLPPPAGEAIAQYLPKGHSCQALTTDQARALLQALTKAGIPPSGNHAWWINFNLGHLPGQPHPSGLHFSPALPEFTHC